MAKSLLARGLGKLKRKKEREEKNAARDVYLQSLRDLPVDPDLVLLEARNGRAIDGNIYYILEVLLSEEAYRGLRICLTVEDEEAGEAIRRKIASLPEADRRVHLARLHSPDYYRIIATAGYLVNDASFANFFIKREGQTYLNVWHGTPLKTMGRQVSHEPHAVGNVQKNFIVADYLLYPSDYMMDHMVRDYMIGDLSPARVLMGGYPRNTAFYDREARQAIRRKLGARTETPGAEEVVGARTAETQGPEEAPGARQVEMLRTEEASGARQAGAPGTEGPLGAPDPGDDLRIYAYMPTWRPELMGARLQDILARIDRGLRGNELMLVNVHPLAEETVDLGAFERIRPFPEDEENYRVLNAADALLTDYSSVFYDYAVTGRKIVLLTYDEKEYFATRGLYEPISNLPFPQVRDVDRALEELRSPRTYDDGAFLDRYCRYESPSAASDLCRRVFLREPCMEERRVPANGLPNVLVWGGDLAPGERTREVMRYLAEADQTKANYFLTFNRKDLKEGYEILFDLPEGIRYVGRAGRMWLDPAQRKASADYKKGRMAFGEYWERVRPAFARERERYYGTMPIDRVLQVPEGPARREEMDETQLEFSAY